MKWEWYTSQELSVASNKASALQPALSGNRSMRHCKESKNQLPFYCKMLFPLNSAWNPDGSGFLVQMKKICKVMFFLYLKN